MSDFALIPMRSTGHVVAPAYPRAAWLRAMAPVSAASGLGSSFVCVTTDGNQTTATEINTKAHGVRRLLETPT